MDWDANGNRHMGAVMKTEHGRDILQDFLEIWDFSQEYFIYGTSTSAESLLKKTGDRLKVVGFLDSNPEVWGSSYKGHPVLSLDEWRKKYRGHKIIVASGAYAEIRDVLLAEGLQQQVDFCDSRFLIGSYFAVTQNKVYLYRTDISITERCNLRCKKCNMLMPYYGKPEHKDTGQIMADIDAFFQWVDNVQILNLLGGEPFLHPHVEEITRYICGTYGSRIEQLVFFTNGMVRLTESMLRLLQDYSIQIQISDYRNGIAAAAGRVDALIRTLEGRNIAYRRNIDNKWLDFGFPSYRNEDMGEEDMAQFFDQCYSPFRGLDGKKLYYCHLNTSAVRAELFEDNPNDFFSLEPFDEGRKKELVRFDLGYTETGYVTYCRRCKGCFAVNEDYTEVAEQLER